MNEYYQDRKYCYRIISDGEIVVCTLVSNPHSELWRGQENLVRKVRREGQPITEREFILNVTITLAELGIKISERMLSQLA